MGFFGKLFGKKDDFDLGNDFSNPPDFSQGSDPLGSSQDPLAKGNDPFGNNQGNNPSNQDLYGGDPLHNPQPLPGSPRPGTDPAFNHDIFSGPNASPTNADNARSYAQGLSNDATPGKPAPSYGGTISGHEAELILERLDTIKAELDAIKQRMMRVERYMDTAEQKPGHKRYYQV